MLTVKQLAGCLGVSSDVVRYYSQKHLLTPLVNASNGYRYFDEADALKLASIRVFRSAGFPLESAAAFQSMAPEGQLQAIEERISGLHAEIRKLELLEARLKEIREFTALSSRCSGEVIDVQRPSISSVYAYASDGRAFPASAARQVREWMDLLPFTHISLSIPKEELSDPDFRGPYTVSLGCGAVERYFRELQLEETPDTVTIPGGRHLIIYMKTNDIFSLTSEDLAPLRSKAAELGVSFTNQTSGRILSVQEENGTLSCNLLIRVRVG